MKRALVIAIILSFALGALNSSAVDIKKSAASRTMEENVIIEAFEATGFDFMEGNINTILYLEETFLEMKEMEVIQKELLRKLEISGKEVIIENQEYYEPLFFEEDFSEDSIYIHKNTDIGYNQITASVVGKEGESIVVIVYSINLDGDKESHIIIDIVKNKGYKDIVEKNYQNKAILEVYGNRIESTIGIVGYRSGKLSNTEVQRAIKAITRTAMARKVDEIADKTYYSTTMYSPLITQNIQYLNKTVNLQAASRYSEYDDKTYLWIATPLITYTY